MNTTTNDTGQSPEPDENILFGIFNQDEIDHLKAEWQDNQNPMDSLRKIAVPILQHHGLLYWDEIVERDKHDTDLKMDILTEFFAVQSLVLTRKATRIETKIHKKGDFVRDENGNPIPTDDGRDYKTYTKDVVEKETVEYDKPYYDYQNNSQMADKLRRELREITAYPNYDDLRAKYESGTNYAKACDLIRNLTQYYIFDDPNTFVERFALLVANAKSKALGHSPKWPVLFSLVGKMGVGKSWLAEIVKETYDDIFGCRSGVTSYAKLLDSNFNSMMMTRGFLSIDEAQGLNKGQCEKLKTYITSTTVDVERKGLDVKTVPNLTTFFSTTNESVKEVMGYQPDRRIVEFVIKDKVKEIDENDLRKWLDEIWRLMPCQHPNAERIKNELLIDSTSALDARMEEVVYDLFKENETTIINGQRLNIHKFKEAVRKMGGVPQNRIRDWCLEKGLIVQDPKGATRVSKKALKDFYSSVESKMDAPDRNPIDDEINELFNTED